MREACIVNVVDNSRGESGNRYLCLFHFGSQMGLVGSRDTHSPATGPDSTESTPVAYF